MTPLGNRISLISKKNIRYEGVLYSINETDSTLALQNVTSFGTEGRDKSDPATAFVAPQEGVHPYLLFRGCDIKDLHVHEQQTETADAASALAKKDAKADPGAAPEKKSETAAAETKSETATSTRTAKDATPQKAKTTDKNTDAADPTSTKTNNDLPPPPVVRKATVPTARKESQSNGNERKDRTVSSNNNGNGNSQRRSNNTRRKAAAVGTGASLLNRKARGAVEGGE